MDPSISCCGVDCFRCEYYLKSCNGCNAQKGQVFWVEQISLKVCPIYGCCKQKKQMDHCGLCKQIPCTIWTEMKDPSWTDEEHQDSIRSRVDFLKRI